MDSTSIGNYFGCAFGFFVLLGVAAGGLGVLLLWLFGVLG